MNLKERDIMYRRILIPTDGSPLARRAIKEGGRPGLPGVRE